MPTRSLDSEIEVLKLGLGVVLVGKSPLFSCFRLALITYTYFNKYPMTLLER